MTKLEDSVPDNTVEAEIICGLVKRSRKAMEEFSNAGQEQVDTAVTALAWSIYKLERARELAELAVKDTGLGNVVSKIQKNQRKTFGALRDLKRVKSVGIIDNDTKKGIIKYAKPVGVVAAVCPSTNPAATPVNKAMFAVKGKNGVIIAPSPSGLSTTTKTVDYMRMELDRIGVSPDLVQVLPAPVNKILTQELMEQSDLVVVTGSQNNVRRAYSSGTPAIGEAIGMARAITYLESIGLENISTYETELTNYLFQKLADIEDITILGPTPQQQSCRGALATFYIKGIHSNDISELLDSSNICIRSGHHCCQPLHKYYGVKSTARASLSFTSTKEEIDVLSQELLSSIDFIKRNS